MADQRRAYSKALGISTTGGYNSAEISIEGDVQEVHLNNTNQTNGSTDSVVQQNESITKAAADDDWADYYIDGVKQIIGQTSGSENNGVVLRAPGTYRVVKGAQTAGGQVVARLHRKILTDV